MHDNSHNGVWNDGEIAPFNWPRGNRQRVWRNHLLQFFIVWVFSLVTGQAQIFERISSLNSSNASPVTGNGHSGSPILSADARFVLFASTADNLVLNTNGHAPAILPGKLNVFVRERTNGEIKLLSVDTNGAAPGNGDSIPRGISTNGHALFESEADNLVAGDTNGAADVFVRDLAQNTPTLISVSANGGSANGPSSGAVMTPDGRYVAFVSEANNLVAGDTNGRPDVFFRDLQLQVTSLISVGAEPTVFSDRSENPALSADGRFVVFSSSASGLVAGSTNRGDIYLHDRTGGTNRLISGEARTIGEAIWQTNSIVCYNHFINEQGNYIVFQASPAMYTTNLGTSGLLLRYNIAAGTTEVIHTNVFVPRVRYEEIQNIDVTPDGRFVAFVANTNGVYATNTCILIWDGDGATTTLASGDLTNGVPVPSTCDWPVMDTTGRFVAFLHNEASLTTNSVAERHNIYVRDLQLNTTTLVNVNSNGIGSPLSAGSAPSMDESGDCVAFAAPDGTLVARDINRAEDVFVRDIVAAQTELISERHQNLPSLSPNGLSLLSEFASDMTGRKIAFASDANNIVPGDTNGTWDVFVRDLNTGITRLVSVGMGGTSANGASFEPAISADGRLVAFTSAATNLAAGDTNSHSDVFVWDGLANTVNLVSMQPNGFSGNEASRRAVIAGNGRYVVFRSRASNLTRAALGYWEDHVYVRDLQLSTNISPMSRSITNFSASPNGQFVAFVSKEEFTPFVSLYVWDLNAAQLVYTAQMQGLNFVTISTNGRYVAYTRTNELRLLDRVFNSDVLVSPLKSIKEFKPKFSADSRFLAFATSISQTANDTNEANDVFLYEVQTGGKQLVSQTAELKAGNAASDFPHLTHDGRFMLYQTLTTDIVGDSAPRGKALVLYDRLLQTNILFTLNRESETAGNDLSFPGAISGDGKTLLFSSWASDLSSRDGNDYGDIFSFTLLDLDVIQSGAGVTISWPAVSEGTYQLQFKHAVNDLEWQDLDVPILIAGGRATVSYNSPGASNRFYRVVGR